MDIRRVRVGTVFVCLVGLVACGGSSNTNEDISSTDFFGTYSDQAGAEGTIALTGHQQVVSTDLLTAGVATLSGTLQIVGRSPIALAGTYDLTNRTIEFG